MSPATAAVSAEDAADRGGVGAGTSDVSCLCQCCVWSSALMLLSSQLCGLVKRLFGVFQWFSCGTVRSSGRGTGATVTGLHYSHEWDWLFLVISEDMWYVVVVVQGYRRLIA